MKICQIQFWVWLGKLSFWNAYEYDLLNFYLDMALQRDAKWTFLFKVTLNQTRIWSAMSNRIDWVGLVMRHWGYFVFLWYIGHFLGDFLGGFSYVEVYPITLSSYFWKSSRPPFPFRSKTCDDRFNIFQFPPDLMNSEFTCRWTGRSAEFGSESGIIRECWWWSLNQLYWRFHTMWSRMVCAKSWSHLPLVQEKIFHHGRKKFGKYNQWMQVLEVCKGLVAMSFFLH